MYWRHEFSEYWGFEEQVLTTLIESGFQKKFKTSVAFIDLSVAFTTVWRDRFAIVIPCKKLFILLDRMLTNYRFQVFLGNKEINWWTVLNGLPQGSVLALTLFNLYIHDLPDTKGLKFQYADDTAIDYQSIWYLNCAFVLELFFLFYWKSRYPSKMFKMEKTKKIP